MFKNLSRVAAAVGLAATLFTATAAYAQFDQGLRQVQSSAPDLARGRLTQSQTPTQFIGEIIRIALAIAGAIAVVFIIIGGFQYMTSAGNAEQAEHGRTTLVNALIGIVVIIMSYVLVTVVFNLASRGQV